MTSAAVSAAPAARAHLALAPPAEEWEPQGVAAIPGGTVLFDEATTFFYEHTWHQFPGDPEGMGHVLHALMLAWAERQLRSSGAYVSWALYLDADEPEPEGPACVPAVARLRHRRQVAGLSQQAVAQTMHTSQDHVSRLERGVAVPKASAVARYAAALDALLGPDGGDGGDDLEGDETRFALLPELGGMPWIVTLAYPAAGPHGAPAVLAQAQGVRCDKENSPQVRLVEAELALVAGVRARPEVKS